MPEFSRCYTPEWVDRLYRGVARNYSYPFRFVVLCDADYKLHPNIEKIPLKTTVWDQACKQLYAIEAPRLVTMGLDTVITGNLNEIFAYDGELAVPRDPYNPQNPCNGVVLRGPTPLVADGTDMTMMSRFAYSWLDDLFPGQIRSYKVHVQPMGLGDARIVYFHGAPKPHEVMHLNWMQRSWI